MFSQTISFWLGEKKKLRSLCLMPLATRLGLDTKQP